MRRITALAVGAILIAAPAIQLAPAHAHSDHRTRAGVATQTARATYSDGWKTLAPIAGGPRQEHSAAALAGKVYVLGGIAANTAGDVTTTTRVEVYDTKRNTWADAAPLPVAMNHPNVAAVAGRIYVLGSLSGGASWQAMRDSFVYDPTTNRWSRLRPMPAGTERGSAAIGVRGSRIYLAGGMRTLTPEAGGLQDTVSTVSAYDVTTGTWASLPDLPQARDHVGGAIVGGTFYVIGGRDRGQANVRDTVYAMDLRTRRWTERAPMPTARGGIASAVVGSKIYTMGGEGNPAAGSQGIFPQNEAYDTKTNTWQRLAPMPVPRHGTAAVAVGRTIYVPGGGDAAGGSPVAVNDAFTPADCQQG